LIVHDDAGRTDVDESRSTCFLCRVEQGDCPFDIGLEIRRARPEKRKYAAACTTASTEGKARGSELSRSLQKGVAPKARSFRSDEGDRAKARTP
jgi:hypothetical protein